MKPKSQHSGRNRKPALRLTDDFTERVMVRLDRPGNMPLMNKILAEKHERVRRTWDMLDTVASPVPASARSGRCGCDG